MTKYKYKIVISDCEFGSIGIEKEELKKINAELIDTNNKTKVNLLPNYPIVGDMIFKVGSGIIAS